MQINWLPLVQKEKDGRVYTLLLPVGASFDDCIANALEIVEGLKELREQELKRKEEADKNKVIDETPVEVVNPA